MRRLVTALTFVFLLFPLSTAFLQDAGGGSPREILERARTSVPSEALSLLERGLPVSGGLRPYYLVELARQAALDRKWKESIRWSETAAEIPDEIADSRAFWHGYALEASGKADSALPVYKKRLETGLARDPSLYLAFFRISSGGAEGMTARLDAALPNLSKTDPETYALSRYLGGLCSVRGGNWDFAVTAFTRFAGVRGDRFPEYAPWAAFYRGWGLYRLGKWDQALKYLTEYIDSWPNHERSWQAAVAAALSAIQAGRDPLPFTDRAVRLAPDSEALAESLLLRATVLIDRREFAAAEKALTGLVDGSATDGETSLAPRALFMLGDLAFRQGKTDEAERRWLALVARFPRHPLSEEALYRGAEAWFIQSDWARSADLFSRYRQSWPSGRFAETSLRTGGTAFMRSGKTDLAIIWWEDLLSKYPKSRLVPDTMADLVSAYRAGGDYPHALALARDYRTRFPAEASRDGMDGEIAELERLKKGETAGSAALHAEYVRLGRAGTAEGRDRGLALAREYLRDASRRTEARELLLEITGKAPKSFDGLSRGERATFAGAFSLLANGYRNGGDYPRAAKAFLSAGSLYSPMDGERAAEALYGAADSFIQAGLRPDAKRTVETLKSAWPDSVWTRRADMLMSAE